MIAVDWGSSSLRAYRLGRDGSIRAQRRADIGALTCGGRFAETLSARIEGWDDELIVLCGMIGGRGGWHEVPYVECPAKPRALAASMLRIEAASPGWRGRVLRIVPGVIDRASCSVADAMRGEETQIVGLLHARKIEQGIVCLPGTHSKWVSLRESSIASIRTAMTGEVYALLRQHSILARLMDADEGPLDPGSFDAGLRRSRDAGGLLHHLFGVRTLGLLGQLSGAQSPSYLSGLLIGHEVQAQAPAVPKVHLIASERLAANYARALEQFGIEAEIHSEQLAATGMYALMQTPAVVGAASAANSDTAGFRG